jgi:butyrate kinase
MGKGGLAAYLGTNAAREVEKKISEETNIICRCFLQCLIRYAKR